jgi:lysophospholipase L1-like esterase
LVTVWLNMDDLRAGVLVDTYERQLTELVRALRRHGQTKVLVANTPPGPPTDDGTAERVAAYNEVIARVAAAEGAKLVDLHAAAKDNRSPPSPSDTGLDLTPEDHASIAQVFADAL